MNPKEEIRSRLILSPHKHLIAKPPYKVQLEEICVDFSKEFHQNAAKLMSKMPSSYFDGPLVGLENYEIENGDLKLRTYPTSFKYYLLTRNLKRKKQLNSEKVFPLCITGITYTKIDNEKHYLLGLKKNGTILSNEIHCVPGGYMEDISIERTIRKELEEESGEIFEDIEINDIGFIYLEDQSNYSFCHSIEIKNSERFTKLDNKETAEFQQIRVIPYKEIPKLLERPNKYFKGENIKISEMSYTMFDLHF